MREIKIRGLDDLPMASSKFFEIMHPGKVYAFYGSMGAGKTTFISAVCHQLGCSDAICSPTFSIINEYDTEKWGKIYHFDCYRLESEEEAFDIGAEDYLYSRATCFVEWPEKIEGLLPKDTIRVKVEINSDGSRTIRIEDENDVD